MPAHSNPVLANRANNLDTFFSQSVRLAETLNVHAAKSIRWEAVLDAVARLGFACSRTELKMFLQHYLSVFFPGPDSRRFLKTCIVFSPNSNGCKFDSVEGDLECPPDELQETHRTLFDLILEMLEIGEMNFLPVSDWLPVFSFDERYFCTAQGKQSVSHTAEALLNVTSQYGTRRKRSLSVVFELTGETNSRPEPSDLPCIEKPCLTEVSLNLPRLAYQCGTEEAIFGGLARLIEAAARVHRSKLEFFDRLISAQSLGPLGFLSQKRNGRYLFCPDDSVCTVSLVGLGECVEVLCGKPMHESPDAQVLGNRIIQYVSSLCAQEREERGLLLEAECGWDESVARRFASLDLRVYPDLARNFVKPHFLTQDISYSLGGESICGQDPLPFEKIRAEAELYRGFATPQTVRVSLSAEEFSASTLTDFLFKVFHSTPLRRLQIDFV